MTKETLRVYKNIWDNPYTGRVWYECGGCKGKVSAKARECKHCKAVFINPNPMKGG